MKIRREEAKDYGTVEALVKAAFDSAEHADGNEQDLVAALRKDSAFIPELSLVAEAEGTLLGYILFTKATVGESTVLALAPLAILPEYQGRGIGSALVEEGHRIARTLGYGYSIVLGSEKYYPRFGYVPADTLGISPPFEVPRENFMACRLDEAAGEICGVLQYAKAFGIG